MKLLRTFGIFGICLMFGIHDLFGIVSAESQVDRCLLGDRLNHKESPSPEPGLAECVSWRSESCCTADVALQIKQFKARSLWNFTWDICGPFSSECEKFMKNDECFTQCEPQLALFADPHGLPGQGDVLDVPICGDYCDSWFEACKNDKTCVANWKSDFDWSTGTNQCPDYSYCFTFAQMYGDGTTLCEYIWGDSYYYETDSDNCMVMEFEDSAENPNQFVVGHCLPGSTQKPKPSPEESDQFTECISWKSDSCCTLNTSLEIKDNKAVSLWNFHWDNCGPLSPECERYFRNDECFYRCEPRLALFENPDQRGYVYNVPICADYCDAWFEACRYDGTCVLDWLHDFDWDTGVNTCPKGKKCMTFEMMYGNGKGLCDNFIGDGYFYATNRDNCMVESFDHTGVNPNGHVKPCGETGTPYCTDTASTTCVLGTVVTYLSLTVFLHKFFFRL